MDTSAKCRKDNMEGLGQGADNSIETIINLEPKTKRKGGNTAQKSDQMCEKVCMGPRVLPRVLSGPRILLYN